MLAGLQLGVLLLQWGFATGATFNAAEAWPLSTAGASHLFCGVPLSADGVACIAGLLAVVLCFSHDCIHVAHAVCCRTVVGAAAFFSVCLSSSLLASVQGLALHFCLNNSIHHLMCSSFTKIRRLSLCCKFLHWLVGLLLLIRLCIPREHMHSAVLFVV